MNNEKSFAKELAELINRHSIDAKLDCPDWVLATVAENAMTAYANIREIERKPDITDTCNCPACQLRRALDGRGTRKKGIPQAFDVPKEVADIAELVAELFPGAKIELHRIDVPRNNPRNRRRNKNKRNNGKGRKG